MAARSQAPRFASSSPHQGEAGVLHLGLGSFHRAHQAVYTAAALERRPGPWGIVGVASRSRRVVDAMRRQGGRYSVLTLSADSPETPRVDVLGVHTDVYVAAEEPGRLTDQLAAPSTRVVTLTVTEHGYSYSQSRGGLDLESADVRHDLTGATARTAVGQLASGLRQRYLSGGPPVAVVSCDNVVDNGGVLGRLVAEFVQERGGPDAEGVVAWLAEAVAFPSTMVDRIVPATEDRHRDLVERVTGWRDEVPVPAEPFSMWVLEDSFPAGRPSWEAGGALLTKDVRDFELLKLRVLNASNSMLAYLGLLLGERYIADAVADPGVRRVVEQLVRRDMLPTLAVPPEVDAEDYLAGMFTRFANRAVGHRTSQVGTDGSTKLPVRVTDAVLHHQRLGEDADAVALLVAAYLRCLCDADALDLRAGERPGDPYADRLAELGTRHPDPAELVHAVLVDSGWFPGRLAEAVDWLDRVGELLGVLRRGGVRAAIATVLQ